MKNCRLVASDLDATLLNSDMLISPNNEKAVYELYKRGILFVPTTGRTLNEIPDFIKNNPYIRYIIYSNGTAIFDKAENKIFNLNPISAEAGKRVLDLLSEYDVFLSVHADGCACTELSTTTEEDYLAHNVNDYYKMIFRHGCDVPSSKEVAGAAKILETFVVFFSSDDDLAECTKRLNELVPGITVTSSIGHNIEICSDKASKGAALKALLSHLGIPQECAISMGDNMNDISMFDVTGLSVCASGGHELAKAHADCVGCSNNESLLDFVLKNYIE